MGAQCQNPIRLRRIEIRNNSEIQMNKICKPGTTLRDRFRVLVIPFELRISNFRGEPRPYFFREDWGLADAVGTFVGAGFRLKVQCASAFFPPIFASTITVQESPCSGCVTW